VQGISEALQSNKKSDKDVATLKQSKRLLKKLWMQGVGHTSGAWVGEE
jgi:hypothetical protein